MTSSVAVPTADHVSAQINYLSDLSYQSFSVMILWRARACPRTTGAEPVKCVRLTYWLGTTAIVLLRLLLLAVSLTSQR